LAYNDFEICGIRNQESGVRQEVKLIKQNANLFSCYQAQSDTKKLIEDTSKNPKIRRCARHSQKNADSNPSPFRYNVKVKMDLIPSTLTS